MIIARTPFRISFFGGGTDVPSFYHEFGGLVLSTSINKYMYITVHPYCLRDYFQIKYSRTELSKDIQSINHPIVKAALQKLDFQPGIEITSVADIPAGTGLGSSSSFTVCLLHCLYAYKGKYATKSALASEACEIEIDILKEPIGKQDQYAAAFGGLNLIRFERNGNTIVNPITISESKLVELESNILIFYTGISRQAKQILATQNNDLQVSASKQNVLCAMSNIAERAHSILHEGCLDDFGRALDESWRLKKSIVSSISNSEIDEWYNTAIKYGGALGGKLLGAGGGGFLLFYCHEENHDKLRHALPELSELKFKFDRMGSQIIFYDNNE